MKFHGYSIDVLWKFHRVVVKFTIQCIVHLTINQGNGTSNLKEVTCNKQNLCHLTKRFEVLLSLLSSVAYPCGKMVLN